MVKSKLFINHYVAQMWGVNIDLLNNANTLMGACQRLAQGLALHVVNSYVHQFKPQGLSLVLVIAESHLAIHTWPELGYMHIDILSCSQKADLSGLDKALKTMFTPTKIKSRKINY